MENRKSQFHHMFSSFKVKMSHHPLSVRRFQFVWVWYAVLFCVALCIVSMMCSVWCLTHIRFTSSKSAAGSEDKCDEEPVEQDLVESDAGSLEAKGITLTFKNISYIVKASTTKDKLQLLNGITGYFAAGKMTALMGSR
jgi:hypothetical protein